MNAFEKRLKMMAAVHALLLKENELVELQEITADQELVTLFVKTNFGSFDIEFRERIERKGTYDHA